MISRRELLKRGALLGAAFGVAGCSAPGYYGEDESALARARAAGIITVGIAGEAPYGYTDPTGRATGEAVEVARVVLSKLGVRRIQAVTVDFGELIAGLTLARQFDLVAAGMSITAERCEALAFSAPDFTAPTAFLVPSGNPKGLTDFEHLRGRNIRIAVLGGAVEARYARAGGVPDNLIHRFADQQAMLDAVLGGRVDCAALTNISLARIVTINPGVPVEVTPGFFPTVNGTPIVPAGGFAFRRGDDDLLDAMNTELTALHRSGEWLRIAEPFGFGKDNVPAPDLDTETLCDP
ncbi:ectoine/hydroxyectoine ABC transporter substrate-binding protein EhuB [Pseudonocardia spinosispora]|uniref:ectoine/hydroxyectoine ABC transporter substrate-binding protein EhuB n=1 Tax=Pseudonocardia spinosispora TaxID=103441 RepID=UPI000417F0F7|nr:ectoine/hydroxyectoine ABC transporter substrate-binding protein EhuB [Pseudonocardia spinosispora]